MWQKRSYFSSRNRSAFTQRPHRTSLPRPIDVPPPIDRWYGPMNLFDLPMIPGPISARSTAMMVKNPIFAPGQCGTRRVRNRAGVLRLQAARCLLQLPMLSSDLPYNNWGNLSLSTCNGKIYCAGCGVSALVYTVKIRSQTSRQVGISLTAACRSEVEGCSISLAIRSRSCVGEPGANVGIK